MFLSGPPRHLPQTRNGCERVPELLLPHQQWAFQPSTNLVQLLGQQMRISHSSMQIRAAETYSSAPPETCEMADQVQVGGGFRCSNMEFYACFSLTGQKPMKLQLCFSDRAGTVGGPHRFGSLTLLPHGRDLQKHIWKYLPSL